MFLQQDVNLKEMAHEPVLKKRKHAEIEGTAIHVEKASSSFGEISNADSYDDLPPNWIKCRSKKLDGRDYYFNTVTGKSIWEHPNFCQVGLIYILHYFADYGSCTGL